MKGFNRTDLAFSLCGLHCCLFPMHLDGYCPGCGGGQGNQSCAIARCSLSHGQVEYCFLCPEFPCQRYQHAEEHDSFITHQRQIRDLVRAQEIGLEAYHKELERKAAILKLLLSRYNDGRKKSFYCLAVNLLPLSELEAVMDQARIQKKEAAQIVALFQQIADQEGITLKLRKKSRKSPDRE